jgi:CBS domain-containing protein
MRARDIMTPDPVTVPPETPLAAVATLMADRGISGLPVVEESGRLVGVITDGDLMRRLAAKEEEAPSFLASLLAPRADQAMRYARTHGRRVRDVMTRDVVTVEEDATVEEVAHILESRRIRRVPVLRDGKLVGVVSRADLLRAVMAPLQEPSQEEASDARIRRELIRAMREQPWVSTRFVFPMVEKGVVSFHGFLGSAEVMTALRVLAEGIPGVREVRFETQPPPPFLLGVP